MHDFSGDDHGGSNNAAAIAVGVVFSIIIALLLLGTGIVITIVITSLRVKNKSSQQPHDPHHEGKDLEAPCFQF